jgi:hypothetical protein
VTGRALAFLVATLGAVFLVAGYGFGADWLLAPTRGVPMRASTAFAFTLLGLAIGLVQTFRAQIAYVVACSLAFMAIAAMAWISLSLAANTALGTDHPLVIGTAPGHATAYGTQIRLGLIALSVIVRTLRVGRVCSIVRYMGLASAALGAVGLIGHALGIGLLYLDWPSTGGMASSTAAMLVMLGVATAWRKP